MKTRTASVALAIMACAGLAVAQGPQRLPREAATATIGGKKVTIDYGRPQLKGRSLADLMKQLPADRIWRTGENEVTTFTSEGDLLVGGKKVAAGKYSLYVHAAETGDWSLVLNTDPGIPLKQIYAAAPPAVADHLWPRLDGYEKVKDKEVVRAAMKSVAVTTPVEAFSVALASAKDGATLTMAWGDKSWSIELAAAK